MKKYRVIYLIEGKLVKGEWFAQTERQAYWLSKDFEVGDVYDVETR